VSGFSISITMEALTLAEAKNKRAHIRASATRLKNFLETFNVSQGTRHDVTERKQKLAELWNQFEAIQSRIESLENAETAVIDKDTLLEQQIQQRASFENPYFSLMSRYEAVLEQFNQLEIPAMSNIESNHTFQSRETHIKLPKIDLPVFSGAYEDWYSYQDTFEKLIHMNSRLTEIEKFHYLRSSLKDKAAEIVKSIETTTDNYHDAWTAVKERYDNKRWIIQKHVRAIFDVPTLNKENHVALRELLDTILKHLRALKALKRPTESWDDLIVHIIVSKLDVVTTKAWETSLIDTNVPDLKTLTDFLAKRCQALESIHSRCHNDKLNIPFQKSVGKSKGLNAVTNVATANLSCHKCKANHQLYHCEEFLKLPIEERLKIAKRAHLCLNCLRSTTHQAKVCTSSVCRKCSKKHNTLLHSTTADNTEQLSAKSIIVSGNSENPSIPVATQCVSGHPSVSSLLSTAIIIVYDVKNEPHYCRVLLDSGSQMNFITREFVSRLQLAERSLETSVSGVMEKIINANQIVNVRVKSRFNNFQENIDCVVLSTITQKLPQRFLSIHGVTLPTNIKLADPNFNVPASIDMLIGAELFWRIICSGQIRQSKNQPVLQKTLLGWVVSGGNSTTGAIAGPSSPVSFHATLSNDLNRLLSRFWEVEHNISSHQGSQEEQACEELFKKAVKRHTDGRFIVQLPIKQDKLTKLGNSHDITLRRYKALEARLISQPDMYAEYKRFMQEYIELGHMREVNKYQELEKNNQAYYLPHHAVRNETSTTTKFRVVFD